MPTIPLKKTETDPLRSKSFSEESYKESGESSVLEPDSAKPVNAGNWIIAFSVPLLLLSTIQIGEAIYSYNDNKDREDDFGKDIKEASLHQLIICSLGLFLGIILYILYVKEFASSTTYYLISLLSLAILGYTIYIVVLQYKKYTKYEDKPTPNEKSYSTHAKSLFYADITMMSLIFIIAIICFFKGRSGSGSTESLESIEMK